MMATTTPTLTADQTKAVNALVNGVTVIAEKEITIAKQGFAQYCDTYKDASDALWAAVRIFARDDAAKAGPKSMQAIEDASKGKFKVESEVNGKKVPGTVSKATVSRLRTMQHDSATRRNRYTSQSMAGTLSADDKGRVPTFGGYVTWLGEITGEKPKRNEMTGALTPAGVAAQAKARKAAKAKADTKLVGAFDVSTFVTGESKVDKLVDLLALEHDLKAAILAAKKGMSDKAVSAARAAVAKKLTNADKS
jgi:hypothetical protein